MLSGLNGCPIHSYGQVTITFQKRGEKVNTEDRVLHIISNLCFNEMLQQFLSDFFSATAMHNSLTLSLLVDNLANTKLT